MPHTHTMQCFRNKERVVARSTVAYDKFSYTFFEAVQTAHATSPDYTYSVLIFRFKVQRSVLQSLLSDINREL